MKFQKVIAEALARKTQNNLLNEQNKFVEQYTLPKDKQKDLIKFILEWKDINKRKKLLLEEYKDKFGDDFREWHFKDYNKDEIIKEVSRRAAYREYEVPSLNTLIDDFLILSIDAVDTDDLINKVTAKYVK